MVKIITTIKAILTRLIFSVHSVIAIWQATRVYKAKIYWALCGPLGLLFFEGIFTLAIKKNQEWRWFCPSVFLYLSSVVPAIWLLELEKVQRRINRTNITATMIINKNFDDPGTLDPKELSSILHLNLPNISLDAETYTTLIEQFLMLILIVGRWLLPKGDLTRDQLSQLLLVYIGTAADIIEFFDSYKDDTIAKESLLVFLTLGIWSWSLIQFTIVLSATRSRKSRGGGSSAADDSADCCQDCCCGIDVWGIALNVMLQDAPFLAFRLLIIVHYKIINYMNVFFTCKNSLVILLQLYRLYVVNSEYWKAKSLQKKQKHYSTNKHRKPKRRYDDELEMNEVYMISTGKYDKRKSDRKNDTDDYGRKGKSKKHRKRNRKDTGYSTASSQNLHSIKNKEEKRKKEKKFIKPPETSSSSKSESDSIEIPVKKKSKSKPDKEEKKMSKKLDALIESDSTESSSYKVINEKKSTKKKRKRRSSSSCSSSSSS